MRGRLCFADADPFMHNKCSMREELENTVRERLHQTTPIFLYLKVNIETK